MSTDNTGGLLYGIYRKRVGEPTTHDEVRGYWVFLTGLVLGTLGIVLFLPSSTTGGAPGLSLRELSIFMAAVGLAMLVAGPVIRLPLQSWANYAAYLGQAVCLAAAIWFVLVFPQNWSVQTGNQPVIILYAVGLAIITVAGLLVPLISGVTREDLERSEGRAAELESELAAVRQERDQLEEELDEQRAATEESEAQREQAEKGLSERADEVAALQAELEAIESSKARFELFEDAGGKWRWRLRHRNGNIIADGGQGYSSKQKAHQGLQSVKRNAFGAGVFQQKGEDDELDVDETDEEPGEEAVDVPVQVESKATFELFEDAEGKWRWRLRHDNGNIIADSGEGYASKQKARQGMNSVRKNVQQADYLRVDPTAFEIYRDRAGKYRWRLVHKNGNTIADGGQGYSSRRGARNGVESVMSNAADADIEEGER